MKVTKLEKAEKKDNNIAVYPVGDVGVGCYDHRAYLRTNKGLVCLETGSDYQEGDILSGTPFKHYRIKELILEEV